MSQVMTGTKSFQISKVQEIANQFNLSVESEVIARQGKTEIRQRLVSSPEDLAEVERLRKEYPGVNVSLKTKYEPFEVTVGRRTIGYKLVFKNQQGETVHTRVMPYLQPKQLWQNGKWEASAWKWLHNLAHELALLA